MQREQFVEAQRPCSLWVWSREKRWKVTAAYTSRCYESRQRGGCHLCKVLIRAEPMRINHLALFF